MTNFSLSRDGFYETGNHIFVSSIFSHQQYDTPHSGYYLVVNKDGKT